MKYFLKLDHQFVRRYLKVLETQMLKRFGLKLPWKPDASFDYVHKYDRASLKLLSVKLASRYVASGKFENCLTTNYGWTANNQNSLPQASHAHVS